MERATYDILMKGGDRTGDYNKYSKFGLPSIAIPTTLADYITVTKWRPGVVSQYLLTLTALPYTITDALAYAGLEIIDLAYKCYWSAPKCNASLTFTTTSALASTINASKTMQWGLGSVTASATTLATTMQDIIPVTNATTSATINVASAASTATLAAASAHFDGTTTAGKIFLNTAFATGTDIDGDGTLTVSGTIVLTVMDLGTTTAFRG